ncbi:MAG TPA: hypothetical protein VFM93_07595 [Candidatus Limnocylindria bacterium]|nr:hypothetical protein [Candidatus Limnocylindria bacterium]
MRVLIIEDDDVLADLIADVLSDAGMDVTRTVPAGGVDGVITDLVPVKVYDLAAARAYCDLLRAQFGVPVILLTAHGAAARDGAERIGADEVILKPFDIDGLVARVLAVFGSSAAAPPHHSEGVRSRDWEHAGIHR